MKRILYFYPLKFAKPEHGIHTRIITMLEFFKERGFIVDMVTLEDINIKSNYAEDKGLVNSMHVVKEPPQKPLPKGIVERGVSFIFRKSNDIKKFFQEKEPITALPNRTTVELKKKINELLQQNKYDYLLVTYTYWASIVKQFNIDKKETRTIIDPTDFLTLQQYYYTDRKMPYAKMGAIFGDEAEWMSWYDDNFHISYDELLLFSNFIAGSKHHFIPQFFEKRAIVKSTPEYDIVFFGSNNEYNIEGINWFLNEVFPLLNGKYKIAIAGNVCKHISVENPNIIKLGFVDDASKLYAVSRITICPLKRGSGMKIKVVESLSFGLPVVSTFKGLDGFTNKQPEHGVLVADTATDFAKHIQDILSNDDNYTAHCKGADQLFNDSFSAQVNYRKLDAVFKN